MASHLEGGSQTSGNPKMGQAPVNGKEPQRFQWTPPVSRPTPEGGNVVTAHVLAAELFLGCPGSAGQRRQHLEPEDYALQPPAPGRLRLPRGGHRGALRAVERGPDHLGHAGHVVDAPCEKEKERSDRTELSCGGVVLGGKWFLRERNLGVQLLGIGVLCVGTGMLHRAEG